MPYETSDARERRETREALRHRLIEANIGGANVSPESYDNIVDALEAFVTVRVKQEMDNHYSRDHEC